MKTTRLPRWRILLLTAAVVAGIMAVPAADRFTGGQTRPVHEDAGHKSIVVKNEYVELKYYPWHSVFLLTNLKNGRQYYTEPVYDYRTIEAYMTGPDSMEAVLKLNGEKGGAEVLCRISLEGERIRGELCADPHVSLLRPFSFPGPFAGEESVQYLVVPYAEGLLLPAEGHNPFGEFLMWGHKSTMPFAGMTDLKTGIMLISDAPADTSVAFEKPRYGEMQFSLMQLRHSPAKGVFGYDRVFYIDFIEQDGYNEMAKIFRSHLEKRQENENDDDMDLLVTLRQKAEQNRNIHLLVGAVDFWMGPEGMKSTRIVDELKENGIEKAVVNLQYGWKVYPHEERPLLVDYIAEKGMLPGRYDNFFCVFAKSVSDISDRYRTEGFDEDVIIKKDGSLQEGYRTWHNGQLVQGYRLNPGCVLDDARKYVRRDLQKNAYLSRYIDVTTSARLYEDYSAAHPMTRREDMRHRYNLLKMAGRDFGLVTGTEEAVHWSVGITAYSEGTMTIVPPQGGGWSTPVSDPGRLYEDYTVNPAVRIPLKSLVYHDCHVSGWYTGDSISKVPSFWKTKELLTVLYGAMILVFPENEAHWESRKKDFLQTMRVASMVFEKTGYERMERHEFLDSKRMVQKTTFSGGIEITVNFSDRPFRVNDCGGFTIPPGGFSLREGTCMCIYGLCGQHSGNEEER